MLIPANEAQRVHACLRRQALHIPALVYSLPGGGPLGPSISLGESVGPLNVEVAVSSADVSCCIRSGKNVTRIAYRTTAIESRSIVQRIPFIYLLYHIH